MADNYNLRTETLLDRDGNPVRVLVLDAEAINFLQIADEAVDNGRNWLDLDEDEDDEDLAARKADYEAAAKGIGFLLNAAGVRCGHSACSQHYIDTGSTRCVQED